MRVGADEGVGEGHAVAVVHDRGQELQVHLVDDAGSRWHDAQVAERGLRPAQQLVALTVALVLAFHVERERRGCPEPVHLDAVVDDEVGRDEWVDSRRIAAEVGHRVAHDREVHDRGDAGEVLEDDTRRHERDLGLGRLARPPGGQGLDIGLGDDAAARVPEQVLQQDPHHDRQPGRPGPALERIQPIEVREARAKGRPGAEGVDP